MATQYASDARVTFTLQGLRWMSKEDGTFGGGRERHFLELQYKGAVKRIEYESREARDATYDIARASLTETRRRADGTE